MNIWSVQGAVISRLSPTALLCKLYDICGVESRRKCTFTDCKKDYSNKCSYLQTTRIVCHIYLVPFSFYWIRVEAFLFTRLIPLYHYYFRRDFVLLTFVISIHNVNYVIANSFVDLRVNFLYLLWLPCMTKLCLLRCL